MPKTRKAGRKGGAGMLTKLMGKTQKTKDKDQRINESWEQSSKDQKDWEERRVAEAATNAAAAEKKALTARKRAATLAAKKSDAKAVAEAKEKAILNDRVKSAIRRLSEIESLWKYNFVTNVAPLSQNYGLKSNSSMADIRLAVLGPGEKLRPQIGQFRNAFEAVVAANDKLTIIQAKKAALIKSLEGNNTTTNPRGGRTKKRHYKYPKKGRKSRTHKGRKSRTHKRRKLRTHKRR